MFLSVHDGTSPDSESSLCPKKHNEDHRRLGRRKKLEVKMLSNCFIGRPMRGFPS